MKKVHNKLGNALIIMYIILFVVFLAMGLYLNQIELFNIRNIFYGVTLGWFLLMFPLSHFTLNRTWYKVLPEKKLEARVKKVAVLSSECIGENLYESKLEPAITFEMSDKTLTFEVSIDLYNSVLENEVGILVFKEQGRHIYFVDFERQDEGK